MLTHPRLRFLLADDAGAGKTIMTGLYVREMLARRLLRRVLIIPPAGLLGNWKRELATFFGLEFEIAVGADARTRNPFVGDGSDLRIVSVDTLVRERMFSRLQDPSVEPYELVVFDEAHKLGCDRLADLTIVSTERYRLAESLAGAPVEEERWRLDWAPQHLVLLTATPHMGKDYPYFALWRLLDPAVFSTMEALQGVPAEVRARYFIRRTKEEMVRFDGSRLYAHRETSTFAFPLSPGPTGERTLYDQTTEYLRRFYNQARVLNRAAVRLAMSVFQRRLASSTWALLCSLERRLGRLSDLIAKVRDASLSPYDTTTRQGELDRLRDPRVEKTADEEEPYGGREEGDVFDDEVTEGIAWNSLHDLEAERDRVAELLTLARAVEDSGEDTKFTELLKVVRSDAFAGEKLLVFTEHRDTLAWLERRLGGIGYADQVATIHGGMDYRQRQDQIEFFRRPQDRGGARFMVCTDAAAEGVNLQFCGVMVNYDLPWNPARLEQRMGRIHRYGQKRPTVFIANLLAEDTREGQVMLRLLAKLEVIREALRSEKVFDVVGRLFRNLSLREYLEQSVTDDGAREALQRLEGTLTPEQVRAIEVTERSLYGDGGDVKSKLPALRSEMAIEDLRALLPGYVRRFVEQGVDLLGLGVEGSLDGFFGFRPGPESVRAPSRLAFEALLPALEPIPPPLRNRLTIRRPDVNDEAVFFRPGDPLYEKFRLYLAHRFERQALRGALFADPLAARPYFLHVAVMSAVRAADASFRGLEHAEVLATRLAAVRHDPETPPVECAAEHLLLLRASAAAPADLDHLVNIAPWSRDEARHFLDEAVMTPWVDRLREAAREELLVYEPFLLRGFDHLDAELAVQRARLSEKARVGDTRVRPELERVRQRQRSLEARRDRSLELLRRERQLRGAGEVAFIAHALVVPNRDPAARAQHDLDVERAAMHLARAWEEYEGAVVRDVSTPESARAAGLLDHPGFDLLSRRPDGEERAIEVKGRAATSTVELTENEWSKAATLGARYWLYVVFDCATARPRLLRVRDPFRKLVAKLKVALTVDAGAVIDAAEPP